MKKALSLVMVFLVAVAFSATGYSADKYVSGSIGISWMDNIESEGAFGDNVIYDVDMDSGLTLLGAYGCDYGDYRVEGELGYQSGDLNSVTIGENGSRYIPPSAAGDTYDLTGDLSILSLMANAYYDIDLGGVELSPFVGVGVAQVSVDDCNVLSSNGNALLQELGEDADWSMNEVTMAYQIGAVLSLPVADNVMLDARYRYFITTDFTYQDPYAEYAARQVSDVSSNVKSHSAMLGLRITL